MSKTKNVNITAGAVHGLTRIYDTTMRLAHDMALRGEVTDGGMARLAVAEGLAEIALELAEVIDGYWDNERLGPVYTNRCKDLLNHCHEAMYQKFHYGPHSHEEMKRWDAAALEDLRARHGDEASALAHAITGVPAKLWLANVTS